MFHFILSLIDKKKPDHYVVVCLHVQSILAIRKLKNVANNIHICEITPRSLFCNINGWTVLKIMSKCENNLNCSLRISNEFLQDLFHTTGDLFFY